MGLVTGCKNIRISRTPLKKGKHEVVPTHAITVQEEWIQIQLSLVWLLIETCGHIHLAAV